MQSKRGLAAMVSMLVLAALGCKVPNPYRCPDGDLCPPPGGPCESSGECRAPTPVCDEPSMSCVECLANTDCIADSRPICNDQRCVQCVSHDDCTSNLCLNDGTCADPSEVTYVAEMGSTANPECKLSTPCQNLEQAQAPTALRRYIKVSGSIVHSTTTTFDNKSGIIYGGSGSRLSTSAAGEVLIIKGASNVSLNNLEIVGNNLAGGGRHCVEISDNATVTMTRVIVRNHIQAGIALSVTAHLAMFESMVHDHALEGVLVTGGTLEIRRSRIYGNNGIAGISSTNASMVTIESSTIARNTGSRGGVAITGRFAIRNSIIARNGDASSTTGGLDLSSTSGLLEFNTIANNVSDIGGHGGISCGGTVAVSNNIIVNNAGTMPIETSCPVTFSLTSTTGVPFPGRENEVGEPMFLETMNHLAKNYYRIDEMSAARGGADSTATVHVDIDGQLRDDGAKDMGADEYK